MRPTVASSFAQPFVCARGRDLLDSLQSCGVSKGAIGATRRALILGAASMLGAAVSAYAGDPLASGQFREEVLAVLRRNRPDWQIEAPSDPAVLEFGGREIYLFNLYLSVRGRSGEDREGVILKFADAMASTAGDFAAATFESARIRLRARIYSADAAAANAAAKMTLLTRPFSPKACIAYVIDNPSTMALVQKTKLEQWKVIADDVHGVAIENLEAILRDVPIAPQTPRSRLGLYAIVQNSGGYAAAGLLAPRFMTRMSEELGPEFFVAAPSRDHLIAWSVDCSVKSGLAALVAENASTGAYSITDELFVWSADGIRVANPIELSEHGRD
jgi:uncharacterized protein YtpQ (UPF0354 family)